jgi:FO synthase subunit 2
MYKHDLHQGIRKGASANDALLTHAIARIMLNNYIKNIQMSWVKEGQRMSQLMLMWGANDFGGTLINESISTAAGSEHGQLLKPREIRRIAREINRIPAQRSTDYKILRTFETENEYEDKLDSADANRFGSYFELIKIDKYKFKNPRRA